ncbi:MAG TPA: hypothetical protein VNM92_13995, partial [Thermoanaerobaculia bacterium]|nr:hypothetical protein [Thermoanaerobaculia bacterium]
MGLRHGEETQLPEVGIRPALMIGTTREPSSTLARAKDAAESPPDPAVELRKDAVTTVLEVLEPA